MTLGWFALVCATLCSYRLTRLVVVDDIFDHPRDRLTGWLVLGETPQQRRRARLILARFAPGLAVTAILYSALARIVGGAPDVVNRAAAITVSAAVALVVFAGFYGYRYKVHEGIECRWCVGVWTSAAVTASLALWGGWPIVPTCVFGGAVAGAQCFANLAEDILAGFLEGLDDSPPAQQPTEEPDA